MAKPPPSLLLPTRTPKTCDNDAPWYLNMRSALSTLARGGALLLLRRRARGACAGHQLLAFGSGARNRPALSPLATELLLARRRESHARESQSAEWREALAEVKRACGIAADGGDDEAPPAWQAAAAALQRSSAASPPSAARLFGGDAAADAAELRALLALMAGGKRNEPEASRRATAALVPALAAAPDVVLSESGTRRAAEVLATLRTRAQLSPGQVLGAVEADPALLGYAPARVRDNLLFLTGATATATGSAPPLLGVVAATAPAALGRAPADLRASWEFVVGGGPAFRPDADLRRWPAALEHAAPALEARWALAARLGVRLLRPSQQEQQGEEKEEEEGGKQTWSLRAWVEATPDAIDRALGRRLGQAKEALAGTKSGGGGGGGGGGAG